MNSKQTNTRAAFVARGNTLRVWICDSTQENKSCTCAQLNFSLLVCFEIRWSGEINPQNDSTLQNLSVCCLFMPNIIHNFVYESCSFKWGNSTCELCWTVETCECFSLSFSHVRLFSLQSCPIIGLLSHCVHLLCVRSWLVSLFIASVFHYDVLHFTKQT